MPLTDVLLKNAKPTDKTQKLYDEHGMYLELSPSGSRWFRLKYRFERKEKRLALGVYPDISLKVARERRDEARKLLASGIDPGEHRKAQKLTREGKNANSFEVVTREWLSKRKGIWSPSHNERVVRLFERDIFPWIGSRAVQDVAAMDLLATVRRIEDRGALETAHRALNNCGQALRYAVATGRAQRDPSRDLRGALPPTRGGHFAATTDPEKLAEILRAIHSYNGTLAVRSALKLAPMFFVRPGELRKAEWPEFDLEKAEWRYISTKRNVPHIVPLARQAVEILRDLYPLSGRGRLVFPGARSAKRPMSDNAVLAALRRMGIDKEEMSGHGFRATARTILDEVLNVRPDYIEHQLAHAVRDPNGRAYNRTAHLPERHKMMQLWADYLEEIREAPVKLQILSKELT